MKARCFCFLLLLPASSCCFFIPLFVSERKPGRKAQRTGEEGAAAAPSEDGAGACSLFFAFSLPLHLVLSLSFSRAGAQYLLRCCLPPATNAGSPTRPMWSRSYARAPPAALPRWSASWSLRTASRKRKWSVLVVFLFAHAHTPCFLPVFPPSPMMME